jgi:hypothetical protein
VDGGGAPRRVGCKRKHGNYIAIDDGLAVGGWSNSDRVEMDLDTNLCLCQPGEKEKDRPTFYAESIYNA